MWAEQYVVYDWIRLYAHCDTTRRNFLSAILRNADKGVFFETETQLGLLKPLFNSQTSLRHFVRTLLP